MRKFAEQFRNEPFCNTIFPILGRGETLGRSTDVGDVSWVVPTAQFSTACIAIGTPDYSWQFVAQGGMSIGHKGMLNAAKVLALSALELMQKPELVEKARREFIEKVNKNPYESPLPEGAKPPIKYFKDLYNL